LDKEKYYKFEKLDMAKDDEDENSGSESENDTANN